MDNFHRMHDDLEKVIEKDDTSSTVTGSDCEETLKHGPLTLRQKLDVIIHSNTFQVVVVVLVIFDVLLVLAELLFDLEIVQLRSHHQESVPEVLHYCSLSILALFLVEIALRIFVMRLQFFKHKLELFDALIVIVSFVLDIVFRKREDATSGVGLLVILRLWRVTRILNGIVLSVKRQAEKKIERERNLKEACEQELHKFRTYCTSLESEIEYLRRLLKQHGIQYQEKVQNRPVQQQVSVEVEVEVNPTLAHQTEDTNPKAWPQAGEVNDTLSNSGDQNGAALNEGNVALTVDPVTSTRNGKSGWRTVESKEMSEIVTLDSSGAVS